GGMPPGMGGPPMGGMPPGMGGPPMGGMPPGMGGPMMGGPVMVSGGGGTSKAKLILCGIIGVVVVIGVIVGLIWASGKTTLHVVNNAGSSPLTISVDGAVVSKDIAFA